MPPDRLANYVPVAERVNQAQSELVAVDADPPVMLTDVMGYIRVAVYLSDGRKATGTASFRLDLDGRSAQATNPIEDCETSAVGRALAFLGFSSSRSIASREEVRTAEERGASYKNPAAKPQQPAQSDKQKLATVIARIETLVTMGTELNIKLPAAPKVLNQMSYAELIAHGKALRAAVEEHYGAITALMTSGNGYKPEEIAKYLNADVSAVQVAMDKMTSKGQLVYSEKTGRYTKEEAPA